MTNTPIRLTPRGRVLRNILVAVAVFALWGLLNELNTPDECKVPVEEMSHGCISLLYP